MTAPSPFALACGGLAALAGAVGVGRFIYTPILPAMVEGLDLSKGEAGLIASANFLGYLLGALAAAAPKLAGSPRVWLLAALALSAVTTAAMALFASLWVFLLLRLVGGIASAFVLVFASTLVLERLAQAGRGDLSALHFAGVGSGIALSAVVTWALTVGGGGWQDLWWGGGALSLVALGAVAWLVPTADKPAASEAQEASARRQAWPWALILAYGLFGFGYVITATFIVDIVRSAPALRAYEPWIWLLVGLSAMPSVAAWTAVARRSSLLKAFALACVVEAVGVAASVLLVDLLGLIVAAAFLGGTFMGITALGLLAARALYPTSPRSILAIMTAAFGLGQIIGPLVAGFGFDLFGSFLLPSLLAAFLLCCAAGLALWQPKS